MTDEINRAFEELLKRPSKPKSADQPTLGKPATHQPVHAAGQQGGTAKTRKPGVEQRAHARYPVSFPVYIRLSSGEVVRAHAVNLSLGGIYLEYQASADPGHTFSMLFDLLVGDTRRRVYARAEVVRSVVIGNRDVFGIAFRFTEFARDSEQWLEQYIQRRQSKQ